MDTVRTKTSVDEGFLSQRTDEGCSSTSDSSDAGDRFSSEGSSGVVDHVTKVSAGHPLDDGRPNATFKSIF